MDEEATEPQEHTKQQSQGNKLKSQFDQFAE